MLKTGKKVRNLRKFSDDFKLKIVKEYETGSLSISQLSNFYDIRCPTIYNWIYKFSKYNEKSVQVVELKNSNMDKLKLLEQRIKELEMAVGQKQMNIDYLEKMIDLAKQEFNIDIKKNSNSQPSGGSKKTKPV